MHLAFDTGLGQHEMERGKEEIFRFVREALTRGIPRSDIERALAEAGWQAELIRDALGAFAEVEFPVPVPRPRPYLSAREVFVYLVLFSALYAAAFSLGALVFELIDRSFPDPLQSPYYLPRMSDDRIRWHVSEIIVAFPIFIILLFACDDDGRSINDIIGDVDWVPRPVSRRCIFDARCTNQKYEVLLPPLFMMGIVARQVGAGRHGTRQTGYPRFRARGANARDSAFRHRTGID